MFLTSIKFSTEYLDKKRNVGQMNFLIDITKQRKNFHTRQNYTKDIILFRIQFCIYAWVDDFLGVKWYVNKEPTVLIMLFNTQYNLCGDPVEIRATRDYGNKRDNPHVYLIDARVPFLSFFSR